MLNNLTNRLIKEDIEDYSKKINIDAIVIPANMSELKRYSFIGNDKVDTTDIAKKISRVEFNEDETPEERKVKLYNACLEPESLQESISEEKPNKQRLSMSKDDYEKMKEAIIAYKKSKDEKVKNECKIKFRKFISTVKSNLKNADEEVPVDAFINTILNMLFKLLCNGNIKAKNLAGKAVIEAKIMLINKQL